MASSSATSAGVGLEALLFITFLVLKLCGVIDWSWWWITAPLWGPLACIPIIVIGVYLFQKALFK